MRASARLSSSEDGVSLIEVVVALAIIAVVMTSSAVFFINGLKNNGLQTQRQAAVTLANQALEAVQAVKPTKLTVGRTSSEVTDLIATDTGRVLTGQDVVTSGNYDTGATAGSADLVPTQRTQSVGGVDYLLRTFIDTCYLDQGSPATCTATAYAGSTASWRVTVAVTWTPRTAGCPGSCRYAASLLIDKQGDPKFNTNVSTPAISAVTPSSALVGASRTLTIDGSGFVAGATVGIATGGGSMGTTLTNTGTRITVTWTVGSASGSFQLNVTNPDGGRATFSLTVTPGPAITTILPTPVSSLVPTTVTITGTGFQSGLTLTVPGAAIANVTFVSSTSVTLTLTPNGTQPSPLTLTLTNPDGGSTTKAVASSVTRPVITAAVQGAVAQVGQPTTLTLTGTSFVAGATVSASVGTVTAATVTSSTSATVTYVTTATTQTPTLTLTNPDGGFATRPITVVATAVPLTITAVTPTTVSGGTRVTFMMTGTGFAGPANVSATALLTTLQAVNESVTDSGTLTFQLDVPTGLAGLPISVRFSLTNGDGRTAYKDVLVTIR